MTDAFTSRSRRGPWREGFPAGIETSLSSASIEIRPVKANASGSPTA